MFKKILAKYTKQHLQEKNSTRQIAGQQLTKQLLQVLHEKKRIPGSSRFRHLLLLTFLATYCAHTVNMVLAEFEPSSQRSNASNHPAQDGEFVSLYNDGVRNNSSISLNVLNFI